MPGFVPVGDVCQQCGNTGPYFTFTRMGLIVLATVFVLMGLVILLTLYQVLTSQPVNISIGEISKMILVFLKLVLFLLGA